jgi:cell division protein FtsB
MQYRIINFFLLILSILLIIGVFRSWLHLRGQDEIVRETQKKLDLEKEEYEKLTREYAKVESREYVEKEARNKLNLSKEGEIAVILPSVSPIVSPTPTPIDVSPNWQKWIRVFLK